MSWKTVLACSERIDEPDDKRHFLRDQEWALQLIQEAARLRRESWSRYRHLTGRPLERPKRGE